MFQLDIKIAGNTGNTSANLHPMECNLGLISDRCSLENTRQSPAQCFQEERQHVFLVLQSKVRMPVLC